MVWQRPDGRRPDQLRPIRFERNFTSIPAGSVLASSGETRVLCTVSVQESVPRWLERERPGEGWLTAEYRMLPGSTPDRQSRELLKLSGARDPYPGKLGVIEPGAWADLLLVNGDPLKDLGLLADPARNLTVIIKGGKVVKDIR